MPVPIPLARRVLLALPLAALPPLAAVPAAAEAYRLAIGDRVTVSYDFLETPKTTVIDLDGNLRLAELGRIEARGRTLDEVETAIAEGMVEGGFAGVSYVSVEIETYAPVVVSGYVGSPGRHDFLPGMTLGTAVALAGGVGEGSAGTGPNVDVLVLSARRRALDAAARAGAAAAAIARLEAALGAEGAEAAPAEGLLRRLPAEARDALETRLPAEAERLATERAGAANLVESWNQEIADFEAQAALLDARVAVKEEVVANLSSELADLDGLREQGLTTTTRLSTLVQRLADDREELLALETAKITARRAASLAARGRDRFLSDRRAERLGELAAARGALDVALGEHRLALEEVAALDASAALPEAEAVLRVAYALRGPRADRLGGAAPDESTPLLPGDEVVVSAELALPGEEG